MAGRCRRAADAAPTMSALRSDFYCFTTWGSGRLLVLFLEMSINYQTVFNVRRYDVPHTRS